jgi:hypothetical protein
MTLPHHRRYGLLLLSNRYSWLGRAIWHSMWIILACLLAYFAYDEWNMAEETHTANAERDLVLRCMSGESLAIKHDDGSLEILHCDIGTILIGQTVSGL